MLFPSITRPTIRTVLFYCFVSLVFAYSAYIWIIQTPNFFSLSRLAIGGLVWGGLAILLIVFSPDIPGFLRHGGSRLLAGAVSLFILLNLLSITAIPKIPYTYLFLPNQTLLIRPLSLNQIVEIQSFTTEIAGTQYLSQFQLSEGWTFQNGIITQRAGAANDLVWEGKPGQVVEIGFRACSSNCAIEIQSGGKVERVDLNSDEAGDGITYTKRYPSLVLHQIGNLIFSEAALLLAAILVLMAANRLSKTINWRLGSLQLTSALPETKVNVAVFGGLAALASILYAIKLQPIVYNDDWCQIVNDAQAGKLDFFILSIRRPLHLFFAALYNSFLPLDKTIYAMYFTQVAVLVLTSFFIYRFVRELFEDSTGSAFLCAALWLVFPNDYTYLYLSMLPARVAFLLNILFLILVLKIIRDGSRTAAIAALVVLLISLFMYEGHIGMAVAAPLVFSLLHRKRLTRGRLVVIAIPYAGIAGFTFWKIFIQPLYYHDTKLAGLSLNLKYLLLQGLEATKTLFMGFRLPYTGTDWLSPESAWILIPLILALLLLGVLFLAIPTSQAKNSPFIMIAIGAFLWAAGYIPLILNLPINIYSHLSRVNLYSNLGGAILIVALFNTLASSLGSAKAAPKITLLFILPLLVIGSLVQLQVQETSRQSWVEAKTFYNRLIGLVPDIKPETQILFTISVEEPAGPIRRPLFTSTWEAECAVWSLYGTTYPNLLVGFKYDDIYVPPFPGYNILAGAQERNSIADIPDTSKLVVLNYDMLTTTLEVTQDIGFLDVENPQAYHPEDRILPIMWDIPARKLVAPE